MDEQIAYVVKQPELSHDASYAARVTLYREAAKKRKKMDQLKEELTRLHDEVGQLEEAAEYLERY